MLVKAETGDTRRRISDSMRRFLAAAILVSFAAAVAQENEETLLKVDVDLVSILFSVRDKKGALIPDLAKEEIQIFEDGKQQEIKNFVRETDLPLTIGLLVDVSRSQENLIETERHAGGQFFANVLKKKDMAFLISFGTESELLQDSTNSVRLLQEGLRELRVSGGISGMGPLPGPVPTISGGKGTVLYDTVYLAANEKLKREVGRKALVIITDGVDVGSHYNLRQAIEAAQKADAIIYSIYYADPMYQRWGGGGSGDLKKMSEETGGRMFEVGRKHSLQQIFDDIQNEMRSQYAVAYTPSNSERDGGFRKVEIKTTRKDLKIQARKGYYATPASN